MDDDDVRRMMIGEGSSSERGGAGGGNKRRYLDDGKLVAEDGGVECSSDPYGMCGVELLTFIFSKLDARSLVMCCLVSRDWMAVASSDRIWAPKCEELWHGKASVPRISKSQGIPKITAYSLSVTYGKRTRITWHDLCDHIWEFHFTETAPEYWRNLDPYWSGTGTVMHRYFKPDGTITADPDDRVWGGHESCYTIVTSLLHDDKIRQHYVRINKWPKLSVQRRPDWGWELSNHLFFYSNVPDRDGR